MSINNGILILGGSGFVAQNLLWKLTTNIKLTANIYVISRKTPQYLPNGCYFFKTSIDNIKVLDQVLPKCKWVIHLACSSTPGASASNPELELELNIKPSITLFHKMQAHPDTNLIFISSGGAVYGNTTTSPIKESCALSPISNYGAGKVALEGFATALTTLTPRTTYILRPSNIYGPNQKSKPGFGVIPTIFHYISNNMTFNILGDGNMVRDFIFINDFIDALIAIIQKGTHQKKAMTFNVGSGIGTSINELCNLIESITNKELSVKSIDSRTVDVQKIILDTSKIKKYLSWKPRTPLQKGLTEVYNASSN